MVTYAECVAGLSDINTGPKAKGLKLHGKIGVIALTQCATLWNILRERGYCRQTLCNHADLDEIESCVL